MPAVYFNRVRLKEELRRDFPFHAKWEGGYIGYGRQHPYLTTDEMINVGLVPGKNTYEDFKLIDPFQAEGLLDNDVRTARQHVERIFGIVYFYNNLNSVRQEVILNLAFWRLGAPSREEQIIAGLERAISPLPTMIRIPNPDFDKMSEIISGWGGQTYREQFNRLGAAMKSGDEKDFQLSKLYDSIENIQPSLAAVDADLALSNPELDSFNKEIVKLQREREEFVKGMKMLEGVLRGLNIDRNNL